MSAAAKRSKLQWTKFVVLEARAGKHFYQIVKLKNDYLVRVNGKDEMATRHLFAAKQHAQAHSENRGA